VRAARAALAAALLASQCGCTTLGYYVQSLQGHLALMAAREPIERVIADPGTEPALRERLIEVLAIREFASDALGLPDNASYRSYVEVERPYVVWSVVAAPELSLRPLTWCFPVAGCVAYRGYYAREDANGFARDLDRRGFDVVVRGVRAYSTLGWFDDPVPSTVARLGAPSVAAVVFHELAHQRLYVQHDTAFNEAFAIAVERAGVRRWLRSRDDSRALARTERAWERERAVLALVFQTRARLERVYRSEAADEQKRAAKRAGLAALRAHYRRLSAAWPRGTGFDAWFAGELNNAALASVATYHEWVPAFERLLADTGGDLERFYAACERLAALPREERHARLQALLPAPAAAVDGIDPESFLGVLLRTNAVWAP